MIFFKKNKIDYCFIHIPKTAGTSFEKTIVKHSFDNKEINLSFTKLMKKFECKQSHVPFYFVNNFLKNKLDLFINLNYITIIRNPWARIASLFEQEMMRSKVGLSKINMQKKDLRSVLINNYDLLTENYINKLHLDSPKKVKELFKFWLFYLGSNIL